MGDYNYVDFVMANEMQVFVDFRNTLHVGEKAPEAALTRLEDMASVQLSEYWDAGPVVIEFGSFT